MKQLLLVRHGRPHEGHASKPGDPPLHPSGHAQARALAAKRLHLEPIERIVCSPQQRALVVPDEIADIVVGKRVVRITRNCL